MNVPFTGGCVCGAIRYRCSGAPRYMGNCHCRDCQQATGSAYFPCVLVKESELTLESGEPSWYRPGREIYVASAQPWSLMHPDIPHDKGMPGRT